MLRSYTCRASAHVLQQYSLAYGASSTMPASCTCLLPSQAVSNQLNALRPPPPAHCGAPVCKCDKDALICSEADLNLSLELTHLLEWPAGSCRGRQHVSI